MQNYKSLRINATPCNEDITDLLAAFLCDYGYESFTPDSEGVTAYIKEEDFNPDDVYDTISGFPMQTVLEPSWETVVGEDWNSEWEKNYFKPILIGNEVAVHSSFHTDIPEAHYDIVIDPKMAFGTGHHATTSQMMKHILAENLHGKRVIDMGSGTGILAILCKMKGCYSAVGIEIDPYACENAVENVKLNNVDVDMIGGDASTLESLPQCDLFLANINRNIITGDINFYSRALKENGVMLLSGFYEDDIPEVVAKAKEFGLEYERHTTDNNWVAVRLVKMSV